MGRLKKLGNDGWAIDGCPMDGGGLVISNKGVPETVWRRKGTIYTCESGQPETVVGEGRSCTIESVRGKNVYAWTDKGGVVILKPQKVKQILGKGLLPVIKSVTDDRILCVWENDNQIHSAVVYL